ncbi:MAG TPA: tetratricopeptide repeat protein [Usitatibacteraceae bacterium]|nr:tetratricopeptide repeat protein [Usitatibacteraceae bacterium]
MSSFLLRTLFRLALRVDGPRNLMVMTMKNKSTSHPAPALLQSLLLSAFLAAATGAQANPKLLADAQKQLAAGNPKQAYMMLVAEQGKLAGDADFDYLLGLSALDSGKIDESIIAFERVLAAKPNHAGALLDLGRAYFAHNSLDLAEATFRQLAASNPPEAARMAINRYLQAIAERRQAGKRVVAAWSELSLGYDSNITGVPNDFTRAVESAFNIPGVDPTGNSIKRKAPYLGASVGADLLEPLGGAWTGHLGAEARGRGYRREAEFNSVFGEVRAGATWAEGKNAFRLGGSFNRYNQDGMAPGDPKPTNDRTTGTLSAEYRYSLSDRQQVHAGVSGSRVRFLKNEIEDFNGAGFNAGWINNMAGAGRPVLQFSGFYSHDRAENKLADGVTDKSKRVGGLRGFYQYSLSDSLAWFNSAGFTLRRDRSPFARATEVESGRDKLADLTLGVSWRFQPRCTMRAQWFGSRNDSNIAIYDYTRNEVSSNIRCDFQ